MRAAVDYDMDNCYEEQNDGKDEVVTIFEVLLVIKEMHLNVDWMGSGVENSRLVN